MDASLTSTLLLVGMMAVMYFFMLRPQIKKQKEQQKFGESIAKGQEVVTMSGIIGRISKVEGNVITLQIDPKTFIKVTKGSISKELTEGMASSLKEVVNF